jgi:hypothetical protein
LAQLPSRDFELRRLEKTTERNLHERRLGGVMDPKLMLIGAVIIVAVGMLAVWLWRRRHSDELRRRFRGEYERTVSRTGDVRKAEAALEARAKRIESLHIRPMPPREVPRVTAAWRRVQEQFVDDPQHAIGEADQLVGEVMTLRGYPVADFEQQVENISVDHPDVVMNYRAARSIAERQRIGRVNTEELRQAIVHYRALFQDLLGQDEIGVRGRTSLVNEAATRGQ